MHRLLIASCLLVATALTKPAPDGRNDAPEPRALSPEPRGGPEPVPFGGGPEPVPFAEKPLDTSVQSQSVGDYYWRSHSTQGSGNYPNNIDTAFSLTGANGQVIGISCETFSLEYHSSCFYDYLSINGKKYCGSNPVPMISGNKLDIVFKTDYSVTSSGFKCRVVVPQSGSCQCGVRQGSRVVGGADATAGQFPWQAGLVSAPRGTVSFCGGSLINDRFVLTAAHCTAGSSPEKIQVMLGNLRSDKFDAGQQRYAVKRIIDYPQYTDVSNGWDFSLLELVSLVVGGSLTPITPVCLAQAGQTYAGATAVASGWGQLGKDDPQPTILQHVTLPVWSQSSCASKWNLKSSMLCAGGSDQGGKSVCMGDSGGPLVTQVSGRFRLIGVVSFGTPCAVAGRPDVFGRVTEALPWIASNTANAQYCTA